MLCPLYSRASQKSHLRLCLCTILFCSFCVLCLPFGKAKDAETAKNLPGRRRRPCSQETFEKPCCSLIKRHEVYAQFYYFWLYGAGPKASSRLRPIVFRLVR